MSKCVLKIEIIHYKQTQNHVSQKERVEKMKIRKAGD